MPAARLYLVTPIVTDASSFSAALSEACAVGDVAAVLIRLADADDRAMINRLKQLAPIAQRVNAAALSTAPVPAIVRGGADGVHLAGDDVNALKAAREALTSDRIVGAGGLETRHAAMTAGEAGVDYVMFGEPRADGTTPSTETTREQAAWWAELFEIPCVAFAAHLEAVEALAATGAEFIAVGDAVWGHPRGVAAGMREALAGIGAEELP